MLLESEKSGFSLSLPDAATKLVRLICVSEISRVLFSQMPKTASGSELGPSKRVRRDT
jgi:hypothetical protein